MVDAVKTVNVINLEGKLVSLPAEQLQDALGSGYTQALPEQVDKHFNAEKYGSAGQQAIMGLEGAASALTFGASTGVERALGVDAEDIAGRREENPWLYAGSQMVGLIGSTALGGAGAANILAKAGAGVAGAFGLGGVGAGVASRIGATATKMAVDNLLFQTGDEVSKMFTTQAHPGEALESAAVNIGLAGLIGGGLGVAGAGTKELWNATVGKKLTNFFSAINQKYGGPSPETPPAIPIVPGEVPPPLQIPMEGAAATQGTITPLPSGPSIEAGGQKIADQLDMGMGIRPEVQKFIVDSGMKIDPTVQSGLSDIPEAARKFQVLMESPSSSGLKAKKALGEFYDDTGKTVIQALGKTPEEAAATAHLETYETGIQLKKTLVQEIESKIVPITKEYEAIHEAYPKAKISPTTTNEIADTITNLMEKDYSLSPSSPQYQEIQTVLKELPNLKTAEDLKKYQTILGLKTQTMKTPELHILGGQLKKILRAAEEHTILEELTAEAPELLTKHQSLRGQYHEAMELIDSLNDRLKVGKYFNPSSFIKALKGMKPEKVLRRLTPSEDFGVIQEILPNFPQTLGQVKDYHLNSLLKKPILKAASEGPKASINLKLLFNALDEASPELKKALIPPEAAIKINAVRELRSNLAKRLNPSGSATTLISLLDHIPGNAVALGSMLTGKIPIVGRLLDALTTLVSKEVPDAVNLAFLKYIGSNGNIEAGAFKSMVDAIQNTIKGENNIGRAVKAIFKAGAEVLPQSVIPSEKKREKLDKILQEYQKDPEKMLDAGKDHSSSYLPEQSSEVGALTARAVTYLNSLRPNITKKSPLDTEMEEASPFQKSAFNRALDVAESPLIVLTHIKDGTILPQDLKTITTIYPQLYSRLVQKLTDHMVNHLSKDNAVPYKTRIGLSFFMGQPLDSTMTPASINSIQLVYAQSAPAQDSQEAPQAQRHTSMKNLGKLGESMATANQKRQVNKWS